MARKHTPGCLVLSFALLLAPSAGAQEIVQLPAGDRWLEVEFEELYRLGTMAGKDWEQFGYVRSAAFDGAGNLFLFDWLMETQIVFVVGPDGQLARQLGGRGDGPGEFGSAGAVAVFADGRVIVADVARRGYHLFAADGQIERLVRMAEVSAVTSVGPVVAQPGSEAVIGVPTRPTVWTITGAAFSTPVRFPTSHPFERTILSGEETVTDTIAEAWLPPVDISEMDQTDLVNTAPRPTSRLPEFSPELHWGVLSDGRVAFSDSSTYAVKVAEAGGGVVRILTRPFQPESVTSRMIRAEKRRRVDRLEENAAPGADLPARRRRIEELEFHTELSVIRGLATTWDGHIWVLRRGEGPVDDGPIDVLNAGRPLPGQLSCGNDVAAGRLRSGWSGCVRRNERLASADGRGETDEQGGWRAVTTIDESRMPASGRSRPSLALPPGGDSYRTVVFDELDVPYVVRAKITPMQ